MKLEQESRCGVILMLIAGVGEKKALNIKRHLKFTQHVEGTKSKRQSFREKEAAVTKYSFEFLKITWVSYAKWHSNTVLKNKNASV